MTHFGRTPDKQAQTFTKKQRVCKRREFQDIFQSGKSIRGKWFVVRLNKKNDNSTAKLGLVISKRVELKAVRRNLWKRRVREVFRCAAQKLEPGCNIIIQARENTRLPDLFEIREEFEKQMKALEVWREAPDKDKP